MNDQQENKKSMEEALPEFLRRQAKPKDETETKSE